MLQILRSKAQSTIMQAIVVIIALVFIFWGVGTQMLNRSHSAITINGEQVSFQQWNRAYERALSALRDRFNGELPQGYAKKALKQEVINQFVQDALFRQGGAKMGLVVSPDEVQSSIKNMAAFKENGDFNIKLYKLLLSRNHFTAHGFEDQVSNDMLAQKTASSIEGFASIITDYEIKSLYDLEEETVSVSFVKFSPDSYANKVKVTDKALTSWFQTVRDNYKTPTQVQLQYLAYDYETIAKGIKVDDKTIQDYYNQNIGKFTTPEERRVRHILFKVAPNSSEAVAATVRKKAEKVLKLAQAGKNFAKLAEQYSEGPSAKDGGDLGYFAKGQMAKAFEEAVFSMKPGQISNIVRSPYGFHIIKLVAIKPAVTKPLAEVRDQVINDVKKVRAKAIAFQQADTCYEGIIGAGSLQAYIKKNPKTSVIETPFFSRQSPPADLMGDQKFLNTAFSLKQGQLSSLIETKDGYAILFAKNVKEPVVPPLAKIKDRVTKDFIAEKAEEMAGKAAADLLAKAKTGGDFTKLAHEDGLTVMSSGFLSKIRQNSSSLFPPSLVGQVFQLSASSLYPAKAGQAGKNFYVYKFTGRKIPKMDLSSTELARYRQALLQLKQRDLLNAWMNNERKQAKVTVYKGL